MVPKALRFWFFVHFVVDVAFAIPLFLAPTKTMTLLGWTTVDPFCARLVGAALMGIGIESLLGRNADSNVFRGMLNLKVIWSLSAIAGIAMSMAQGAPTMGWVFLAIFCSFSGLWIYYRVKLG